MAGYRRGVYISEVPTSIISPVTVDSAMTVAFVTAPVHLSADPYSVTQSPKLCYTYGEAVEYFGFSTKASIWEKYTAPQVIYSHFALYAVAPLVLINILDPKVHIESVTDKKLTLVSGTVLLEEDGVLIDTVVVSNGGTKLEAGKDYTLAFNSDGFVVINGITLINGEVTLSYDQLNPDAVDIYDVIGGYDSATGKNEGLELINEIYPRFRLIPGTIIAPGFSSDPAVAAVMETKAGNINGHFRCIAINDIPTTYEKGNETAKLLYTDVSAWKNDNNYISERQINCYPKVIMGELEFYMSTQLASLIARTDSQNDSVPYVSPSSQTMKINGICSEGGKEMVLGVELANYLNGNGILTAINFVNGWQSWGNRTGAYPGNTDVKDAFIPVRRMFDWIGNTVVLTIWRMLDGPMTKRRIKTIEDSINMWFNGLISREYILGGRIEFLDVDNSITDLLDGIQRFRLKIAPPPPAREIDFIMEYDPNYLSVLFS